MENFEIVCSIEILDHVLGSFGWWMYLSLIMVERKGVANTCFTSAHCGSKGGTAFVTHMARSNSPLTPAARNVYSNERLISTALKDGSSSSYRTSGNGNGIREQNHAVEL